MPWLILCVCDALKLHSGNLSWRTEIIWMQMKSRNPSLHCFPRATKFILSDDTRSHLFVFSHTHTHTALVSLGKTLLRLRSGSSGSRSHCFPNIKSRLEAFRHKNQSSGPQPSGSRTGTGLWVPHRKNKDFILFIIRNYTMFYTEKLPDCYICLWLTIDAHFL